MAKVESISIGDFQCHEMLEVDFDANVTTVTGPTDAGKSSILRALRWLALNHPQGDSFIREDEDGTKVVLAIDGKKISRIRSNKSNSYKLDRKEFKSFGSSVPDSVAAALNLDEVNFQEQHDAPFWLSLSSGEVSRRLNAIVDLGVIDRSLSAVARILRGVRAEEDLVRERLKVYKDNKKELAWAVEADAEYKAVEELEKERSLVCLRISDLSHTIESIRDSEKIQETAAQRRKGLIEVGRLGRDARLAADKAAKLRELLEEIKESESVLAVDPPDISDVGDLVQEHKEVERKIRNLNGIITTAKRLEGKIEVSHRKMERTQKALGSVKECPVCGSPL